MELLQLQYFIKLAQTEHVSRTAEILHISQPALSATIRKLERELGVPLLEREGRGIRLSPYGKAFLPYAVSVFHSLENAKRELNDMAQKDSMRLSVGVASPYIWQDLLHGFRKSCPQVELSVYSLEKADYTEPLRSGAIDLYLGGLNFFEGNDLKKRVLYQDDMVLLVNRRHPLAEKKTVDLSECGKERFINLNKDASLQQLIRSMYQKAGLILQNEIECDYTLRDQMVIENYGISVTTRKSAQSVDSDETRIVDISFPAEKRVLGLVWVSGLAFTAAMRAFFDFACQCYSSPE